MTLFFFVFESSSPSSSSSSSKSKYIQGFVHFGLFILRKQILFRYSHRGQIEWGERTTMATRGAKLRRKRGRERKKQTFRTGKFILKCCDERRTHRTKFRLTSIQFNYTVSVARFFFFSSSLIFSTFSASPLLLMRYGISHRSYRAIEIENEVCVLHGRQQQLRRIRHLFEMRTWPKWFSIQN